MEDKIVLEEYSDVEFNTWAQQSVEYPCVFISGISSNDEIEFFRKRRYTENTSVPAYVDVNGEPVSLGRFDLTLHGLLTLRSIFDYELHLFKDSATSVRIDINDPETLMKFIKL